MLKAVLDTNVIISATIVTKSNPAKILELWRKNKYEIIVTPAIIEEIGEVIFRPAIKQQRQISDTEAQNLLVELQKGATMISPTHKIKIVDKDPADDEFIIAAIEGQVDYIVSGDQHLLELGSYKNIRVVSPKEFIKILEKE